MGGGTSQKLESPGVRMRHGARRRGGRGGVRACGRGACVRACGRQVWAGAEALGRSSGYEYCSSCISESFSHGVLFFTGSGVR